jgi:hypothetical protein
VTSIVPVHVRHSVGICVCYSTHIVFVIFPCVSFNLTHMQVACNSIAQSFTKVGQTPPELRATIRIVQRCAGKPPSRIRVTVPIKFTNFTASAVLVKMYANVPDIHILISKQKLLHFK